MSTLTRKDITALFGELDDVVIAKIIAIGATRNELAEAHAWIANDEPLMNAGRPLPSGRVGRDEPCDRYVIRRRISKQLFEHDRRRDAGVFMQAFDLDHGR
jgi:hypothetical protein